MVASRSTSCFQGDALTRRDSSKGSTPQGEAHRDMRGEKKIMRTSRDMSYYMINRISKQQTNGKIQCKSCQRTRKSAMFEGTIHILPVQKFASMLCSGKSCDFFCHLHLQLWGDHEIIRWFLQKASEMIPHHERSCGHLMVKPLSSLWMVVA